MTYTKKVIDHFENPRNVGTLDKTDPNVGTGLVGAPACGDVMRLQIKVNDKGVYAAYIRARQWGKARSHYKGKSRPSMRRRVYTRVARRAKRILKRRGVKRGGTRRRR